MTTPYTEEDVELVRAAVVKALAKPGELSLGRTVLDALAAAGRLVPPGSEVEQQIGSRVWHADDPDRATVDWTGRALAEERVRIHAEVLAADPRWRGRAEIVTRQQITTPWSPSVPDTKEET